MHFADGRSESVGESRSRVLTHDFGLPPPELQVEYYDADGLIGRVDFDFPGLSSVTEFDGRLKYAGASSDVLVAEKLREDRLRGIGLAVVRTRWSDLDHPRRTAARIARSSPTPAAPPDRSPASGTCLGLDISGVGPRDGGFARWHTRRQPAT